MTIFIVRQTYAVVALFWRLCHDQLWEFAVFLSVHVSPTAWACSLCVWQVLPGRCWQSDQRGDEGEGRGAGCDDLPRWKWMIRRRRRTGEEDCGRLALACASLVRDYEASGGHKLTVALKTIWLRAACFLSIVLFFSFLSILHGLLYEYAFPHLQQTTIFRIDLFHGWFIRQGSISCCGNIEWILCPSLNTCIHVSDIWCNDMKHSSAPTSPEKEPDTKAQS